MLIVSDEPTPTASVSPQLEVDDDVEVAMTQAEVNLKCPYTGMEMKNPVTNIHCKHNYDREGIMQFIKQRGRRAKYVIDMENVYHVCSWSI